MNYRFSDFGVSLASYASPTWGKFASADGRRHVTIPPGESIWVDPYSPVSRVRVFLGAAGDGRTIGIGERLINYSRDAVIASLVPAVYSPTTAVGKNWRSVPSLDVSPWTLLCSTGPNAPSSQPRSVCSYGQLIVSQDRSDDTRYFPCLGGLHVSALIHYATTPTVPPTWTLSAVAASPIITDVDAANAYQSTVVDTAVGGAEQGGGANWVSLDGSGFDWSGYDLASLVADTNVDETCTMHFTVVFR